jgi:hypothetical protein
MHLVKNLRRKTSDSNVLKKLTDLIYDSRVAIIGSIRQVITKKKSNKKDYPPQNSQKNCLILKYIDT